MRDTFRMRRRSEQRRKARELRADAAVAPASPAELLEQVRLHKVLVELVLAMDEPFRSTILSRFVEGLTTAEIARATDTVEGTVRWRLHEVWIGFFGGFAPNWKNLELTDAPSPRDEFHRLRLTSVNVDK
jgi:hypothetical protein